MKTIVYLLCVSSEETQAEPKIGSSEETGRSRTTKDCAARRLPLELPPRPVPGSTHNVDNNNVTQKPIVWPARTKKDDHRNGFAMHLPVDWPVRTQPPEKKNNNAIQLPIDLHVKTQLQGGRSNNKIQLLINKLRLIHATELMSSRLIPHADNRYVQAHTQALEMGSSLLTLHLMLSSYLTPWELL